MAYHLEYSSLETKHRKHEHKQRNRKFWKSSANKPKLPISHKQTRKLFHNDVNLGVASTVYIQPQSAALLPFGI